MNFFGYYEHSEDAFTEDKKIRLGQQTNRRQGNEVVFKGRVNLSSKEISQADEVWLVKVPRSFNPERLEGHEIDLEDKASSVLELNNGVVVDANVSKVEFKLPLVCPQKSKELATERLEHGLKAEAAYNEYIETAMARKRGQNVGNAESFQDLEEDLEVMARSCKGTITLSRHVDVGSVPKPKAEIIEKIAQPIGLKRRHPFFGLDSPPRLIEKVEEVQFNDIDQSQVSSSKKRKKRSL